LNGRPSFTTLKFYHSFIYSKRKNGLVAFTVAILAIFLKKLSQYPFVAFSFSIEPLIGKTKSTIINEYINIKQNITFFEMLSVFT